MPLMGRYPYEVSKSCTDLISQSYFYSYGLPVTIARCGNIYGGGDINWSRIVPGTVRSLLLGQRPQIRSDGQFVRDYIYVKDIARAYMCLAEGMQNPAIHGEAFNFSDEAPMTVLELVNEIRAIMQSEHLEPEILNTASGEIKSQYLSAEKARTTLGWKPAYSRQDGLSETIAWYRRFFAEQPHD
jgi:CDP-glucose 4,6-dehydratase